MTYILTIAGSDTLSGGGLQTDLATFKKNNLFGFVAITSIVTIKDKQYQIHEVSDEIFQQELDTLKEIPFAAIKIGLLPSISKIKLVAQFLENFPEIPIVLDPVLVFKENGDQTMADVANSLIRYLMPKVTITTPNLKEAIFLTNQTINNLPDMERACKVIVNYGVKNVLIKGGHRLPIRKATDVFYNGQNFTSLQLDKLKQIANGSGCMLASEIASQLAKGYSVEKSVSIAKKEVFKAIQNGNQFGVNP